MSVWRKGWDTTKGLINRSAISRNHTWLELPINIDGLQIGVDWVCETFANSDLRRGRTRLGHATGGNPKEIFVLHDH